MITEKDIRPIPKYILKAIMQKDKKYYPTPTDSNRFSCLSRGMEKRTRKSNRSRKTSPS